VLTSIKANLFPDRSVRFLSNAISLWKVTSSESPKSDPAMVPRVMTAPIARLFDQDMFTTDFRCAYGSSARWCFVAGLWQQRDGQCR
jgi:hypothetical protein